MERKPDKKVIVFASGGPDSLALVVENMQLGKDVIALHRLPPVDDSVPVAAYRYAQYEALIRQAQLLKFGVITLVNEFDPDLTGSLDGIANWLEFVAPWLRQWEVVSAPITADDYFTVPRGERDAEKIRREVRARIPHLKDATPRSKAENLVLLFDRSEELVNLAWSCTNPQPAPEPEPLVSYLPCGECNKCVRRAEAEEEAKAIIANRRFAPERVGVKG